MYHSIAAGHKLAHLFPSKKIKSERGLQSKMYKPHESAVCEIEKGKMKRENDAHGNLHLSFLLFDLSLCLFIIPQISSSFMKVSPLSNIPVHLRFPLSLPLSLLLMLLISNVSPRYVGECQREEPFLYSSPKNFEKIHFSVCNNSCLMTLQPFVLSLTIFPFWSFLSSLDLSCINSCTIILHFFSSSSSYFICPLFAVFLFISSSYFVPLLRFSVSHFISVCFLTSLFLHH